MGCWGFGVGWLYGPQSLRQEVLERFKHLACRVKRLHLPHTRAQTRNRQALDGTIVRRVEQLHRGQKSARSVKDIPGAGNHSGALHGWGADQVRHVPVARFHDQRVADREEPAALVDFSLHRHVYSRKANPEEEIEATVHDAVAVGGRHVGVGCDVEEVPVLDLNVVTLKSATPFVTQVRIYVPENEF